jgi:thiol:disulfide interchange protein DsbC
VQKNTSLATLLGLPLVVAGAGVSAQELTKEELASRLNGVAAEDISEAPIPGIYQVSVGANVAYVTKDGRYIIRGDIYDAETSNNVSEETRARARATMLDGVDPASMIVFKPASGEAKHTITIFTDIDCGYCRQFHREIDKVTALGIEVHYLFYPRTGPDTESWTKADQVWCAPNHNSALTRAKLGGEIPEAAACATPVEAHYELGKLIGVRGTPAVFTDTGELIGGYLPPATLIKMLDDPNAVIEE